MLNPLKICPARIFADHTSFIFRTARRLHAFLTQDTLPSEVMPAVALASPWLYPTFAFVPVLGVSIPSAFFGQRGITPAFGYSAPHLSARGTLTLLINVLLSTHYGTV